MKFLMKNYSQEISTVLKCLQYNLKQKDLGNGVKLGKSEKGGN